jgi:DNA-binding GntR family transcriptional regulator
LNRVRRYDRDDELWGLEPRVQDRTSLHAQTTARLRDLIIRGTVVPGQHLVEADLCRRLGVSRTPLREAFKVLASEGLIDIRPNRGATVVCMSAKETIELFQVIANLEAMGAQMAAVRLTEENLARLKLLHDRLVAWHAEARRHEYFDLNQRIHRAVVALSGNHILAETHARLIARVQRSQYQAILSDTRWSESVAEHGDLMAAFSQRDSAGAAEIWRRHVLRTGEVVAESLSSGDSTKHGA